MSTVTNWNFIKFQDDLNVIIIIIVIIIVFSVDFSYRAVQNNYNQLVNYFESYQAIAIVFVFWYNN